MRADKVRQAVSLWRAIQTWQWREDAPEQGPAGGEPGDGGLRYDFAALDHLRRRLVEEEEWWRGYFAAAGVEPLTIVYERFADGHDEVVRAVLRHLEIPFDGSWTLPSPTVRRQSDGLSREWAERYAEIGGRGAAVTPPRPNILYLHSHDTGRQVQPYGAPSPPRESNGSPRKGSSSARPSARRRRARRAGPACSPGATRTRTACSGWLTGAGR